MVLDFGSVFEFLSTQIVNISHLQRTTTNRNCLPILRLIDMKNIRFIQDLDIHKTDLTVKSRIIQLSNQPVFKNPDEIYSMEMILMDEHGTKIHANVLQKRVPKFRNLLQEGAAIFIKNPTIPRHASKYKLNVIGEVVACETMVTLPDNNEKPKDGRNLFRGNKIQETLWDAFAQEFSDYVSTNKDNGIVIIVIQFAMVKIYRDCLIRESGESKSSQQLSMLSRLSYSYREDFLDRTNRANIVEISETIEAKSLIILGTVKAFRKDILWFYMVGRGVTARFRIPLRVQNDTGIVSLTLFDREANMVMNQSATRVNGDLHMFLDDLDVLLDRKFAIKIDINDYNIKNSCFIYGISKLTDDDSILNELEMRFAAQQPAESESVNLRSTGFSSQEKLKDAVSCTGENVTPSDVDKRTAGSPESLEKLYDRRLGKGIDRKRGFEGWSDADQEGKGSTTKTLNIPKVEK
ncbi:uncharacterized protein LOC112521801 [Cynara cardunculus var. scolymus]|uniref:uncharacterized protein LOC112521801 n=1 Tax=Cynara cardunculus var. scolymus TaxID=59895 RepID=UPI000D62E01B|nr:uncharacterized protein LOC112521801 [Cynara cardunculus var. scolymus]